MHSSPSSALPSIIAARKTAGLPFIDRCGFLSATLAPRFFYTARIRRLNNAAGIKQEADNSYDVL